MATTSCDQQKIFGQYATTPIAITPALIPSSAKSIPIKSAPSLSPCGGEVLFSAEFAEPSPLSLPRLDQGIAGEGKGEGLSYDFSRDGGEKEPLGEGGCPLVSGEGRIGSTLTV